MKNFVFLSAVCVILAIIGSGCSTAKVNYKINSQGNLVVEQTVEGQHGISDNAVSASRDAADFEKNMVIKAMWKKYLAIIEQGKISEAEKLLIEIKKASGEIPIELPEKNKKEKDIPPNVNEKSKNPRLKYDNGDGKLSRWKK